MEFKHKKLENGLTIVGEINKSALSAALGYFVRSGSRDETPAISGVSHFLEHMLFKGTEKLSALEVNESFDRLGDVDLSNLGRSNHDRAASPANRGVSRAVAASRVWRSIHA